MNALWTSRICAYKNSPLRAASARQLIKIKVERQLALLKKYKAAFHMSSIEDCASIKDILLYEAREAKAFWHGFKLLLPASASFPGRIPHAKDPANLLLDIGYHQITNKVRTIFEMHSISSEIGLLHVARTAKSAPLAYDLVEMFRSDLVDSEVLRFLRLKKKTPEITPQEISHFIHRLNKHYKRLYYLKDFNLCETYEYYMELQILKFMKAVNHQEVFQPMHLPTRHDMRCTKLTRERNVLSSTQDKRPLTSDEKK